MSSIFYSKKIFHFFLFSFFLLTSFSWAETPLPASPETHSLEETLKKERFSAEFEQAESLKENFSDRLQTIQEDLSILKNRLKEDEETLKKEAGQVEMFLEIQEISPEEFTPYLNRWKIMRDSYREVLEETHRQSDEVNQILIRVESKLRLWKLKEADAKLLKSKSEDETQKNASEEKMILWHSLVKSYEEIQEQAKSVLAQLGKTNSALTLSLEICETNYELLAERWKNIRFTYLRFRQQPKFSLETFQFALRELDYNFRNYPLILKEIQTYFNHVKDILPNKPLKSMVTLFIFLLLLFGFHHLRQKVLQQKNLPEEITLFERFGQRLLTTFIHASGLLLPILVFGLILANFSETRETLGVFLFLLLVGIYAALLINRSLKILFVDYQNQTKLLSLSDAMGLSAYRRLSALTVLIYFFVVILFASSILEHESEATRFMKWILEISIFGILLSLTRTRWLSALLPANKSHLLKFLQYTSRLALFIILISIIGFDALGYTYLSDYLADASLKSLTVIFLILFLKKGFIELIEYKIFTRTLTQLRIQEDLRVKWKKTLRQWTNLALWALLIFWTSAIWQVTPELSKGLAWILSIGFQLGNLHVTLGLLFSVFFTLYFSILISRLIRALLERNIYPRRDWDPGIQNAVSTGLHYFIILSGLIVALYFLGFDIRNITVLAGALGVGLGFGLQNLANNFASGIVLLIERPVKVGDIIQIGTLSGKVKRIGARSTALETGEHATILIPNGELLSAQVTNWTYTNALAGLAIPVHVAHGTDLEKLKTLLIQVSESHPDILKNPAPHLEFKVFGESSLDFILRVVVKDVSVKGNVQTDLMYAIERILRENKIEIPYPHREVILHSQK